MRFIARIINPTSRMLTDRKLLHVIFSVLKNERLCILLKKGLPNNRRCLYSKLNGALPRNGKDSATLRDRAENEI